MSQDPDIAEQFARVSLAGIFHNRATIYQDINRRKEAIIDAEYALHLMTDAVNWASKNRGKLKDEDKTRSSKYSTFATDVAKQLSEAAGGIFAEKDENETERKGEVGKSIGCTSSAM